MKQQFKIGDKVIIRGEIINQYGSLFRVKFSSGENELFNESDLTLAEPKEDKGFYGESYDNFCDRTEPKEENPLMNLVQDGFSKCVSCGLELRGSFHKCKGLEECIHRVSYCRGGAFCDECGVSLPKDYKEQPQVKEIEEIVYNYVDIQTPQGVQKRREVNNLCKLEDKVNECIKTLNLIIKDKNI